MNCFYTKFKVNDKLCGVNLYVCGGSVDILTTYKSERITDPGNKR